jgi:hypothetical protein
MLLSLRVARSRKILQIACRQNQVLDHSLFRHGKQRNADMPDFVNVEVVLTRRSRVTGNLILAKASIQKSKEIARQ